MVDIRTGEPEVIRVHSLDGVPAAVAYRPDGSLVTVHLRGRTAVVRTWNNPFRDEGNPDDWEGLGNDLPTSPDGSRFLAFAWSNPAPDGTRELQRLILDRTGRVVMPVSAGEPIFCADGRHLVLVRQLPKGRLGGTSVIADLDSKQEREFLRFEESEVAGWYSDTPATRLLVAFRRTDAPDRPEIRALVGRAQLHELPSGRKLAELVVPPDQRVHRFDITPRHIRGITIGSTRASVFLTWDTQTGEFLGVRPPDGHAPWEKGLERVVRGGPLTVRTFGLSPADRLKIGLEFVAEVWDAGKDAPGTPPRFTVRATDPLLSGFYADPSPDGKRLLAVFNTAPAGGNEKLRRAVLYDAVIGRPLLTLHLVLPTRNHDPDFIMTGHWSADSNQYWLFRHKDGRMFGWDFRPREAP